MPNYDDLTQENCIPCQGGTRSPTKEFGSNLLLALGNRWIINEYEHLSREYLFKNFIQAMNLANKVATLAEKEVHHTKLTFCLGKCTIEIWLHKINSITENILILAAELVNL